MGNPFTQTFKARVTKVRGTRLEGAVKGLKLSVSASPLNTRMFKEGDEVWVIVRKPRRSA